MVSKWKRSFKSPKNHPLAPKSLYSALFSEAAKTYTPGGLKAKRRGNRAIHPHVGTNGYEEFAKSQKSNALNADIADFYP